MLDDSALRNFIINTILNNNIYKEYISKYDDYIMLKINDIIDLEYREHVQNIKKLSNEKKHLYKKHINTIFTQLESQSFKN